ncbi:MAG: hypothetical protein EXR91_05100 [Gemmatimonadetes bacterium]|nr:hypothetical protein [Gemmatimonadota bacterium]
MSTIRLVRALFVTAAVAASAIAPPTHAQTPPRTSWGDPDLQGVWNYGTMTPLERPTQWAGREVLSEDEAVAYEQQTIERRADALSTAGPDWWELENNVLRNRRTSLIVDPPDGRIPPLATPPQGRGRGGGRGGPRYDNPEDLSLQDRCIAWPATGPPMMPTVYNNNVLIVQARGYVVLVTEMIHNARIVPMDGRPHDPGPSMYGDPRGHWEADTLVVESVGFDGRLPFRGSGRSLHLTERFTRTSDGTLEYRFTVEDATVWSRPWTVRIDMGRSAGLMYEFACHEGNDRSVSGILGGARYEERNR